MWYSVTSSDRVLKSSLRVYLYSFSGKEEIAKQGHSWWGAGSLDTKILHDLFYQGVGIDLRGAWFVGRGCRL